MYIVNHKTIRARGYELIIKWKNWTYAMHSNNNNCVNGNLVMHESAVPLALDLPRTAAASGQVDSACSSFVILSSCNISDAELRFTWRHIMVGHLQVRVTIKLLNHSH